MRRMKKAIAVMLAVVLSIPMMNVSDASITAKAATVSGVVNETVAEDARPFIKEISVSANMVTGSNPWNNSTVNVPANVVDGKFDTFFDGVSNGYVMIDLGTEEEIAGVAYAPRTNSSNSNYAQRCVNASFYGSKDGESWQLFYTITETPAQNAYTTVYADSFYSGEDFKFRYVKYAVPEGDSNACCNVSEIKLYRGMRSLAEEIGAYKLDTEVTYSEKTKTAFETAYAKVQELIDTGSTDKEVNERALVALDDAYNSLAIIYTYDSFSGVNGDRLYDNNGVLVQAHGGQVQKLTVDGKTKWYWIGEDKTYNYIPCPGIHMYSSDDLYNWVDEGVVLKTMNSMEQFETDEYFKALYGDLSAEEQREIYIDLWQGGEESGAVIERPKMLYNEKTGKYVIWFHADGKSPFDTTGNSNYAKAKAGIAIADNPAGPYKLLGSFLLDTDENTSHGWDAEGGHVRDMNLFKDDDGTAYVMYSSEGNAVMYIAKLNDEYTGLAVDPSEAELGKDFAIVSTDSREAPAMFKYNNMYYMITSGCTGWAPNQAAYAVAETPFGPWVRKGDPCVGSGAATTYDTQSTCVIPVDPEQGKYIYMGDRWHNPDTGGQLKDSRYVWLPIEFGQNHTISIDRYENWKLEELDNLGGYEIETELPVSVSSIGQLAEVLPTKMNVKMVGATESEEVDVIWDELPTDEKLIGSITLKGKFGTANRTFMHEINVIPSNMIYFFDAGASESGESKYFDLAKNTLQDGLRNKIADPSYTGITRAGNAGEYGVDYGIKSTGTDIWNQGIWAEGGKDITYSMELEAGSYKVATGYHEWWSTNRYNKITVRDAEGNTLKSTTFTLASTDTSLQKNISFTIENNTTVTVSISKTSGNDPVMSWLAVLQTEKTGTLVDKSELTKTAEEYEALVKREYMSDDWKKLEEVYKTIEEDLKNPNVDEAKLAEDNEMLKAALANIRTVKSVLEAAIKSNTVTDSSKYTGDSWNTYSTALSAANNLLKKSSVTEREMNNAVSALVAAKSALKVKPVVTPVVKPTAPAKASISSASVKKGKKVVVKWKADQSVDGYEIQYCQKKDFKKGVKTKKASKTAKSLTLSKLKKGKVYYVRVRGYKNVQENGKVTKLYGEWSKVKKTKKIK